MQSTMSCFVHEMCYMNKAALHCLLSKYPPLYCDVLGVGGAMATTGHHVAPSLTHRLVGFGSWGRGGGGGGRRSAFVSPNQFTEIPWSPVRAAQSTPPTRRDLCLRGTK